MIAVIEDDDIHFETILKPLLFGSKYFRFSSVSKFVRTDHEFNLVVTDLGFLDDYGVGVIDKINQHTNALIFAVTSLGGEKMSLEADTALRRAGCVDVISKMKLLTDPEYFTLKRNTIKEVVT